MKVSPLGSVCTIVNGGTPKSGVREYWGGDVAWLTPAEMGKRASPHVAATARTLTLAGLNNSSAKLVPPGSVILSTRAPIGHLAINETPMSFNQGCRGIVPSDAVDAKFLYYFLLYSRDALNDLGTGTTFKELAASKLAAYPLPHPPLQKQRRIVAVLDEALAGIATATANAEKNLANARELFESDLDNEIIGMQDRFDGLMLANACDRITVGHVGSMKTRYQDSGVTFLRSQNIRPFELSLEGALFIDDKFDSELEKSRLRPGDVAVVRTGYPGTAAVIPPTLSHANCADLVIIRPSPALNADYLVAFLNSQTGKRMVAGKLNGAAQKHFNVGAARQTAIPLPPLDEQRRMIRRVAEVRGQSQRLAATYSAKLAALTDLKQSLLQKAFAGELH